MYFSAVVSNILFIVCAIWSFPYLFTVSCPIDFLFFNKEVYTFPPLFLLLLGAFVKLMENEENSEGIVLAALPFAYVVFSVPDFLSIVSIISIMSFSLWKIGMAKNRVDFAFLTSTVFAIFFFFNTNYYVDNIYGEDLRNIEECPTCHSFFEAREQEK